MRNAYVPTSFKVGLSQATHYISVVVLGHTLQHIIMLRGLARVLLLSWRFDVSYYSNYKKWLNLLNHTTFFYKPWTISRSIFWIINQFAIHRVNDLGHNKLINYLSIIEVFPLKGYVQNVRNSLLQTCIFCRNVCIKV